ncbi:hypothetical protein [Pseudonocardia sp. HH130630-07]|uniref:hypothetical protein n=1 Tax=Pseudonocardia sp. HH130630-07 TaxID=1690815 RepID=UPI000839CD4A|nr:hypothetical protein [Pseudonocardia sp. HH130630-07]
MTATAEEQGAALRRLVGRLDETAAVLAGVRSGTPWDDARGREWGDRLDLVRRAVRRLADDVLADAVAIGAGADDPAADDPVAGYEPRDGSPAPVPPARWVWPGNDPASPGYGVWPDRSPAPPGPGAPAGTGRLPPGYEALPPECGAEDGHDPVPPGHGTVHGPGAVPPGRGPRDRRTAHDPDGGQGPAEQPPGTVEPDTSGMPPPGPPGIRTTEHRGVVAPLLPPMTEPIEPGPPTSGP